MLKVYAILGSGQISEGNEDMEEERRLLMQKIQQTGLVIDKGIKFSDVKVARPKEPTIFVMESQRPCVIKERYSLYVVPCGESLDQNILVLWVCHSVVSPVLYQVDILKMDKAEGKLGASYFWVVELVNEDSSVLIDGFKIDQANNNH